MNHRPLDYGHCTLPTELLKLAEVKLKIAPSSLCCNAKMVLNSILGTKYSAAVFLSTAHYVRKITLQERQKTSDWL